MLQMLFKWVDSDTGIAANAYLLIARGSESDWHRQCPSGRKSRSRRHGRRYNRPWGQSVPLADPRADGASGCARRPATSSSGAVPSRRWCAGAGRAGRRRGSSRPLRRAALGDGRVEAPSRSRPRRSWSRGRTAAAAPVDKYASSGPWTTVKDYQTVVGPTTARPSTIDGSQEAVRAPCPHSSNLEQWWNLTCANGADCTAARLRAPLGAQLARLLGRDGGVRGDAYRHEGRPPIAPSLEALDSDRTVQDVGSQLLVRWAPPGAFATSTATAATASRLPRG